MTRRGKVVLGIAIAVPVTFCLGTAAVFFHLSRVTADVRENAAQAAEEGRAFGTTHDFQGCENEALARVNGKTGLAQEELQQRFLLGCLAGSGVPTDFCNGVPTDGVIAISGWASGECARRGARADQACISVMHAVPRYCAQGGTR